MREVLNLAGSLRDTLTSLRAEAERAKNEFHGEHKATQVAIGKVKSLTKDLKQARQQVEGVLGEAGSNFQEVVEPETGNQEPACSVFDSNGVCLNRE